MLGCNQLITRDAYPEDILKLVSDPSTIACNGGSVIIAPGGDVIAGPVLNEERILYADLDLEEVTRGKYEFDVVGHYNRPDVFLFRVNKGS